MKYSYDVRGMKCGSCVTKIKEALKTKLELAEVTLEPPRIIVQGKIAGDLDKLQTLIKETGNYTITPVNFEANTPDRGWIRIYAPLFIIVTVITISSFAGASNPHDWMLHFMAGFFLVFGSFKLFDLKGFRDAYATYDLLAKRWTAYGYIYPFLELGLGFAFLFKIGLTQALWLSLGLMTFSALGVTKAVLNKQNIRCACLGTTLNLPMSTITLVEDWGMALMSAAMLLY